MVSAQMGGATAGAQYNHQGADPYCRKWRGCTVQILCDNAAVVAILNKNLSRDREIMHLLHCLAFITAKFQFLITESHISLKSRTQLQMCCQEKSSTSPILFTLRLTTPLLQS